MINLRENIWAVDAPDPEHAVISGNTITWSVPGAVARGFMVLPPGTWEIVCTSKEADEDDAFQIIESMSVPTGGDDYIDYYKDYLKPDSPECWPWIEGDPMASFRSLLAANGCDLNKNLLIVKKIA